MLKRQAVTLPEHEMLRRVRIAGQQIDAAPGGRLGWVLEFVRSDPAKWLPGDQQSHGERLLACALPPIPDNRVSWGPDPDRLRATLTPAEVRRYHRELRDWLQKLVSYPGGLPGVAVPMKGYQMVLVRATAPGEKPAIFVPSPGGPLKTMLFHRVAQWIVATDRLVACLECGKPALALRRRLFCGSECLQAHHDQIKIAKRKMEKRKGGSR